MFGRWCPRGYITQERKREKGKRGGKEKKKNKGKKEKREGVKGVLQYPKSFPLLSWFTNLTVANFLH